MTAGQIGHAARFALAPRNERVARERATLAEIAEIAARATVTHIPEGQHP